jgi:hypothetical protein
MEKRRKEVRVVVSCNPSYAHSRVCSACSCLSCRCVFVRVDSYSSFSFSSFLPFPHSAPASRLSRPQASFQTRWRTPLTPLHPLTPASKPSSNTSKRSLRPHLRPISLLLQAVEESDKYCRG